MLVAVTGANGFVGLNVVQGLLDAGHAVRAVVRPSSDVRYLARLGARILRTDFDDERGLDRAFWGVEGVVHCAGATSCDQRDLSRLVATNVEGTRAVVRAALRCEAARFVYTSTTATIGARHRGCPSNEYSPLQGFRARSAYARTKAAAERIVLEATREGLAPIVLNVAEVIGPWDHTLQWGRTVLAVCHDHVPFVAPGAATFCSAVEVGRAHAAALERGTIGARYILGGADASYRELVDTIAAVAGLRPCLPRGSYALRRARARLAVACRRFGAPQPLVDPYRMRLFAGDYRFDSARAVRDLGYRPASLVEMVRSAWAWYRAEGMVPPSGKRSLAPCRDLGFCSGHALKAVCR
ncbi:MAG: NAD-dependent epimerase/dehydratase family protein [Myxococcales bacterium]